MRRAVEDVLTETSAEQVTVPLIAGRAGVHASSIYRRWGDVGTLIADVVRYRLDPGRPIERTGVLRADAVTWALELAHHFGTPQNTVLLRAGAALAGDEDADCTAQWRAEAAALIDASSTSPPQIRAQDLTDHVLAPIVYRAVFSHSPMDDAAVTRLVDDAFAAARGRRNAADRPRPHEQARGPARTPHRPAGGR